MGFIAQCLSKCYSSVGLNPQGNRVRNDWGGVYQGWKLVDIGGREREIERDIEIERENIFQVIQVNFYLLKKVRGVLI